MILKFKFFRFFGGFFLFWGVGVVCWGVVGWLGFVWKGLLRIAVWFCWEFVGDVCLACRGICSVLLLDFVGEVRFYAGFYAENRQKCGSKQKKS